MHILFLYYKQQRDSNANERSIYMKKILISVLICAALILAGATALAEGNDELTSDMHDGSRTQTIENLFDTYNPTGKQTFLDLKAEHQAFHEGRTETRTEVIQYYAGQLTIIAGQVADGIIAHTEGREQIASLRNELTTLREEIQGIQEQKQIETSAIKDDIIALRELIKEALKQDEIIASEIASYLEQFNDLLEEHLKIDYKYADMVDILLPAY